MDDEHTPQQIGRLLREIIATLMKSSPGDVLHVMQRRELSMTQVVALWYLHRTGTASIGMLRNHLNLSLAATSYLVDRLVDSEYVSRTEDPADRRCKQVTLTDAGQALVAELERAREEEFARRLAAMPPDVWHTTAQALEQMLDYLHTTEQKHMEQREG